MRVQSNVNASSMHRLRRTRRAPGARSLLAVVAVAVADLDVAEALSWLDRIVGADDPRRERFADVVAVRE